MALLLMLRRAASLCIPQMTLDTPEIPKLVTSLQCPLPTSTQAQGCPPYILSNRSKPSQFPLQPGSPLQPCTPCSPVPPYSPAPRCSSAPSAAQPIPPAALCPLQCTSQGGLGYCMHLLFQLLSLSHTAFLVYLTTQRPCTCLSGDLPPFQGPFHIGSRKPTNT